LQAEVFADVVDALKRWRQAGVDLRIYSSGSILAQQLFFGHSTEGDLTSLFSKHYDTTSGSKKEAASYLTIAKDIGLPPEQIVFFTDVYAEIQAASQAGMQVVACLRPNNVPLPSDYAGLMIESFDSIEWN
jgi:enolase-phosphatase E1